MRCILVEIVIEYFEYEKDSFELFEGRDLVFSMWYLCMFIVDGKIYNCVK